MRLRRVAIPGGTTTQVSTKRGWVDVPEVLRTLPGAGPPLPSHELLDLLRAPKALRDALQAAAETSAPAPETGTPLLPFQPASFRDFMLYEEHAIAATRGYAKRFLPGSYRLARLVEKATGRPFPAFRPKPLWYEQPIYYTGNHLAFIGEGQPLPWPDYCTVLDYELELGFVLAHSLLDATPEEAEAAIGGFVIFNDVSARNVQLSEMTSGFGPQKAKHFCNVLGPEVVTADEVLPRWQTLTGEVRINGQTVARVSSARPHFSLGQALAYVSRGERLYPGELFATGTLPNGCGLENGVMLRRGDRLELVLHGLGALSNPVAS